MAEILSPLNTFLFPPISSANRTCVENLQKYPGSWSNQPVPHYRVAPSEIVAWLKTISESFEFSASDSINSSTLSTFASSSSTSCSSTSCSSFPSTSSTSTSSSSSSSTGFPSFSSFFTFNSTQKTNEKKSETNQTNETKEIQEQTEEVPVNKQGKDDTQKEEKEEDKEKEKEEEKDSNINEDVHSLFNMKLKEDQNDLEVDQTLFRRLRVSIREVEKENFMYKKRTNWNESSHICIYIHSRAVTIENSLPKILKLCIHLQMPLFCIEYPGYLVNWDQICTITRLYELAHRLIKNLVLHAKISLPKIIICGEGIGAGIAIRLGRQYPQLGGVMLINSWTSTKDILLNQMRKPLLDEPLENLRNQIAVTTESNFDFLSFQPVDFVLKWFRTLFFERMPNLQNIQEVLCPVHFVCDSPSLTLNAMNQELIQKYESSKNNRTSNNQLNEKNQVIPGSSKNIFEAAQTFREYFSSPSFQDEGKIFPEEKLKTKTTSNMKPYALTSIDPAAWKKILSSIDAIKVSSQWMEISKSKTDFIIQRAPLFLCILCIVGGFILYLSYRIYRFYRTRSSSQKGYIRRRKKKYALAFENENEDETWPKTTETKKRGKSKWERQQKEKERQEEEEEEEEEKDETLNSRYFLYGSSLPLSSRIEVINDEKEKTENFAYKVTELDED